MTKTWRTQSSIPLGSAERMWLAPTFISLICMKGGQPSLSIPSERNLCFRKQLIFAVHLSQTSCMHYPEWEVHTPEFTTSPHEDLNVFKSRRNPNKTITPDCLVLNSHWLARPWVNWRIKNVWHYQVTLSWNNKEERLLIKEMADQDEHAVWEMCHRLFIRKQGKQWASLKIWIWNAARGAWKCRELRNKRLGSASSSLLPGWHLSHVLS